MILYHGIRCPWPLGRQVGYSIFNRTFSLFEKHFSILICTASKLSFHDVQIENACFVSHNFKMMRNPGNNDLYQRHNQKIIII